MLPVLNDTELRVLGCLMEKSVLTPDQYPMTLNGLTNACNQKSSREPVLALDKGAVERALRDLSNKHLVRTDENFKRGVDKYTQRFCNTPFSEVQLESDEFAVLTLLILRGPQTPGELRARSGRLHAFDDNNGVVATAEALIARPQDALLMKLPKTPGRKDAAYMHLLSGDVDVQQYMQLSAASRETTAPRRSALEQRVSDLEAEVARLRALIEPQSD
ncbi:MAG: DUF480 domain-containing protein [Pseudomonadota bacterium]